MMRSALLLMTLALGLAGAQDARSPAPGRTTCKPGDAVLLTVENEAALTDTFVVTNDLSVVLPNIGAVSVAGVPRDDLTAHFTRELAKYLRHPTVTARAMVRLAVIGEVARPGFYAVPVDVVFADALMAAGGPTKDAKVQNLFVERSGKRVHSPDELRAALERNATVDQIALQSGDMINIPKAHDTETWVRIAAMVVTIPLAIFTFSRTR